MEPNFDSTSPVNTLFKNRPDGIPGLSAFSLPDFSAKNAHCRSLFSPGPAAVLSPVTNLALDMNNLAGLGRYHFKIGGNVILFVYTYWNDEVWSDFCLRKMIK